MQVRDVMSPDPRVAAPSDTIRQAARTMAEIDSGFLPVGENDRLVGAVTDRDIAIRGVAEGLGPDAKVADVMTEEVRYCFDDEDVTDVARNMGDLQIRRLPVVNRDKRLVGIVSLGDIAIEPETDEDAADALSAVSRPGGPHSQTGTAPF
jgi:CBS domain-containing protein